MRLLAIFLTLLALETCIAAPGLKKPPKGFSALFNGKDLAGWHGMPHFDPYALDKCPRPNAKRKLPNGPRTPPSTGRLIMANS